MKRQRCITLNVAAERNFGTALTIFLFVKDSSVPHAKGDKKESN